MSHQVGFHYLNEAQHDENPIPPLLKPFKESVNGTLKVPLYIPPHKLEPFKGPLLGTLKCQGNIVTPRKLEHGFKMISAGIPYTVL